MMVCSSREHSWLLCAGTGVLVKKRLFSTLEVIIKGTKLSWNVPNIRVILLQRATSKN